MRQIQIAIDTPVITKSEYMRRTGLTNSTFNRQKEEGLIITMERKSKASALMVNMAAMFILSIQQAEKILEKEELIDFENSLTE